MKYAVIIYAQSDWLADGPPGILFISTVSTRAVEHSQVYNVYGGFRPVIQLLENEANELR